MLDSIRSFFGQTMSVGPDSGPPGEQAGGEPDPADSGSAAERDRIQMAAAALLLELVYADDEFTDDEREHLEGSLQRHFGLDDDAARQLIELAEAERATAVDLYQFTNLIRSSYDLGQKTVLAEVMWGLVLADGEIADHESYMLRRIAKLLDLKPGYLSEARKTAHTRWEKDGG